MPDSTSTETYVLLPELLYEFKKYMGESLDLPMENFIKMPEIEYNVNYISSNNIFKILFDNNYGIDLTGLDTSSGYIDTTGIIDDMYLVTDNS
jgi:hypothetical protein